EANPEEMGDYFQGDIVLSPRITMRNGMPYPSARWPNATVPYELLGEFTEKHLATIHSAFEEFHVYTCVQFVPRTYEDDYLTIVSASTGCWANLGRRGGQQWLNLQIPSCVQRRGTIVHELNHVLGFLHEQNRAERDDYVEIQYQNISPNREKNFIKVNDTLSFGMPYDYGSIMHYSARAFTVNGNYTLL
ncbi:hypothetical protein KR222_001294, partial [Zaprionus bogoriensis]